MSSSPKIFLRQSYDVVIASHEIGLMFEGGEETTLIVSEKTSEGRNYSHTDWSWAQGPSETVLDKMGMTSGELLELCRDIIQEEGG